MMVILIMFRAHFPGPLNPQFLEYLLYLEHREIGLLVLGSLGDTTQFLLTHFLLSGFLFPHLQNKDMPLLFKPFHKNCVNWDKSMNLISCYQELKHQKTGKSLHSALSDLLSVLRIVYFFLSSQDAIRRITE